MKKIIDRICWDCPDQSVNKWQVKTAQKKREGCLFTISCSKCSKESQVFGWMIGCECDSCKNQMIGAAK